MRRYNKTISLGLFALLLGLQLAACAGPPVQEMSDARQAIHAAEEAGADQHAPVPLRQARGYLDSAESKLQKRAYNGARKDARLAREKAAEAMSITHRSSGSD